MIVGDSHLKLISSTILQERTGKNIALLKAYNSRKYWRSAFFPEKSFTKALEENKIKNIVFCTPTSDLTNVKDLDEETRKIFADISTKTLITSAEWCFNHYALLENIVIFEHLPRCDTREMANLRTFANHLIQTEVANSVMRSRISVRSHIMDPRSPSETFKLFGNHSEVKFDGIHLNVGSLSAKMFFDSLSSVIDEL